MTAAELIADALRLAGVIAAGEMPDSTEYVDGLRTLQGLLDNWSTEGLTPYARVSHEFPVTPGVTVYTIGPGATWDMPRPIRIRESAVNGCPVDVAFDGGHPTGSVIVPDGTTGTITLVVDSEFALPDEPNSAIDLPKGYPRALKYALAVEFAAEYGHAVRPDVASIAAGAKADIKRAGMRVGKLGADSALMSISHDACLRC